MKINPLENQDLKAQILGKLEWLRINHDMSAKTMTDQEYWRGEVLSHIESLDKLFQDPNVFIGRWQSMESAPRDVPVWGFWSNKYGDFQGTIHWGYCGYANTETWCHGTDGNFMHNQPTAWAHLPTAPEAKE